MKLFVGETVLCYEVKEWSFEEFGYIDHITIIYDKKDDEIIKGPFIVHHVDEENCSVTFARVDPDDEYVPDGYVVTITKKILSKATNVCITIKDGIEIHLFPYTTTVNPDIFKMWENCEKDNTEMYLKYHDPKSNKNMLVQVWNIFTRSVIIDYISDFKFHRKHLPESEEYWDLDVEVIVW